MSRTLTCSTTSGKGAIVVDEKPLGKGGEGSVYSVLSHQVPGLEAASNTVVKLYHNPEEAHRAEKVQAMVDNAPKNTSVAWPMGVVFDEQNKFSGYVMLKLDKKRYQSWAALSNAGQRKRTSSQFSFLYAMGSCANLAIAIQSVHDAGHRVGDINESNIFVATDARVIIIDTDSAQIKSSDGKIYPCTVGKPEYTSAELTHDSLRNQKRTKESDVFAYMVAVFQMLSGGSHPADAKFIGEGNPPTVVDRIRNDWYPKFGSLPPSLEPVERIPVDALPSRLLDVFKRSFNSDPSKRPSLTEIFRVESDVQQNLKQCSKVKNHYYDKRDGSCGWCQNAKRGKGDPWNLTPLKKSNVSRKTESASLPQTALPHVSFGDTKSSTQARPPRASASTGAPYGGARNLSSLSKSPRPAPRQFPSKARQKVSPKFQPTSQRRPLLPYVLPTELDRKKGKTYIALVNGKYIKRPALSELFRQKEGKLAMLCLEREHKYIVPWRSLTAESSSLGGFLLSLIVWLPIFVGWVSAISEYAPSSNSAAWEDKLLAYYLMYGVIIGAAFSLLYLIGIVIQWIVIALNKKKQNSYAYDVPKERSVATAVRMAIISVFYALAYPLFVLWPLVLILRNESKNKRR